MKSVMKSVMKLASKPASMIPGLCVVWGVSSAQTQPDHGCKVVDLIVKYESSSNQSSGTHPPKGVANIAITCLVVF